MDSDLHLGFFKPSPPPASTEDAPKAVYEAWLELAKENWKIVGTGLAVLSLASISLYAFFKSSSKKDAQLMPAKKTELEKLRALAEKKAQWRQSDDADLDKDFWDRFDNDPVEAVLDGADLYLDEKWKVPMEESTLAKDVPPLGLKEIYVTPKKSPSHKKGGTPSRLRLRDLMALVEVKTAECNNAVATIERQADVIQRHIANYEELQERLKNEARFRVEAEQMAKAVSDQLFVLRESLKASEEQKARLEAELKASHQRFTVALSASENADAPEQLTIFDDLRRENIEARDELDRLKQLHAKQLAITMREKSRLEMQVKEMQDEVERLRRPQQNSMYSHYASSTFGLNSNSNSNQNDSSYFSPIQHSTQPSSVMGFVIPSAVDVHRSRSIVRGMPMATQMDDDDTEDADSSVSRSYDNLSPSLDLHPELEALVRR